MTTMLAARAHRGADSIVLEQIPIPEPGPRDVVVKVAAAGLAPGLMRLLKNGLFKHLPTTLGHEAAGIVTAIGAEVDRIAVGDRVRVHPNLNCRDCTYCRTDRDMMCPQQAMIGFAAFGEGPMPLYDEYHDGGLAEYIRVPYWLIDQLPDSVGFDVAAKVHDLANAVRALKCADLPVGSTIVVTAATGTMGTSTVKLAEHFGVSRLILVSRTAERLHAVGALAGPVATELVALDDLADDWQSSGGLTRRLRELVPNGADAVIDFIPDGPVTGQAMAALATGATLVHMGGNTASVPLPAIAIMSNCWRFVGTRSCTRTDASEVLKLLGTGALIADELITQRFALGDAVKAVDAMQRRSDPMWMTVVNP
ncbi:alcohol dehydrogenase catalytic domain-containing protein [Rhodococcus sp. MSC1_016]|jgi:threonine dehydrogenase-like Zn-dependent dehydrogenase|uniref:alcohol dehydrogenase catalytic domain-containing protein n=1 Tax=Rhodococcus sp. MSC1_016 TaxID=2909266 RepID=UPI0022F31F5F|nr:MULTISPECIES: alcohol dehydrogenase catalytic domain-containing protein [Rhodococcus]GLK33379.1 galactitol-1-phosphate 5-dehydrogenase [Rhodococcus wratislaviensis]